jgi:hypothetical protein
MYLGNYVRLNRYLFWKLRIGDRLKFHLTKPFIDLNNI